MWLRPHIPAVTIRVPCSPPWIPAVLTALSASTSSGSQASPVLHQKRRPAAATAEVRTSASPPTLVGSPPRAFAGLSGFPSLPPVSSYFPYDGQKPEHKRPENHRNGLKKPPDFRGPPRPRRPQAPSLFWVPGQLAADASSSPASQPSLAFSQLVRAPQ